MNSIDRLNFNEGFDWNHKQNHVTYKELTSDEEEIDKNEDLVEKKIKKKKKKNEVEYFEEQVSVVGNFDPESPLYQELSTLDECDRLVLSFPNSSKAWLLYMVFHLKQAEIDKARHVAEKAIKTISFRNEKEKQDIWFALLNLENLYGTPNSMMDVFQRATTYNEPKSVYHHLSDLLIKSNKSEEAENLLETMVKKFKRDKDVWIKFASFYMMSDKPEKARQILERCFKSLDPKQYPDVKVKFAQLEYKYGDSEKGKTLFQNLIQNYPKRKDILCTYINILRDHKDEEELEKVTLLLSSKRKRSKDDG